MSAVKISVSSAFDGGNIKHIKSEGDTVYVEINPDPYSELEKKQHMQYFAFRTMAQDVESGGKTNFIIQNAGQVSFPWAWPGSTVFTSSDFETWRRVLNTSYDRETGYLKWTVDNDPSTSIRYFAYFPPYSYERHLKLISQCARAEGATVRSLGLSLDGREMDCITVGTGPLQAWIVHRQHPGEAMAEYFAEGLLTRLLGLGNDSDFGSVDGLARKAREIFTFNIVPNMCPDGSVRGHLRTNSAGANLNREWAPSGDYEAPTLHRSPEVYHVLNEMNKTGVDFCADIHGEETLPFNFIPGNEGIPNWNDRLKALHGAFLASYSRTNTDMQAAISYPPARANNSNLALCAKQVGHRFDCFAFTLEMPFKDCLSNPDPERGWSPQRSRQLGASILDPMMYVSSFLRKEGVSEASFPTEDAYILPTAKYQ